MVKNLIQILSIALFFFLIGFALTYPFILSYHGSETVVLLENSYEKTSLEELISREEFKGKVLYIRVWEPFETETKPYTEKQIATFKSQLDSLKDKTDTDEYNLLSMKVEGRIVQPISIEEQLNALEIISRKYEDNDVAFVFIATPDNDFQSRKDDMRKWKTAVKKYATPGYHLIMNPRLTNQTRRNFINTTFSGTLPHYFIADKQGNILNNQIPWPQDTTLLYLKINQLLSN